MTESKLEEYRSELVRIEERLGEEAE